MKNKRHKEHTPCSQADADALLRDLDSPDDSARAKAVRSLCPCRLGWTAFEQGVETLYKLQKDTNPDVRAAALHVFEDAAEMESSGLPTHRSEGTNEMLRTKRASRFRKDEDDLVEARKGRGTERIPRRRR